MNYEDIGFSQENQTRGQKSFCTVAQAAADPKRSKLGQGKGLTFSFILGEIIWFPKVEDAWPSFRPFNGTEIMYISGFSEKRKRIVHIPISTFRRIPAGEGEIESFYDIEKRPLNCELAEFLADLERFVRLCEVGRIICDNIVDLHGPVFEQDSEGKFHRVKDQYKDIRIAGIQPYNE